MNYTSLLGKKQRNISFYLIVVALLASCFPATAQDTLNTTKNALAPPLVTDSTAVTDSAAADTIAGKDTLPKAKSASKDALEAPIKYDSKDSIRFMVKKSKIVMYGQGNVTFEDIKLKSEIIEMDMEKKEVYAKGREDSAGNIIGRPNFTQGAEVFDADTLKYNIETKKGLTYGVFSKQNEGYLHSYKTKVMPNKEVNLKGGKFTTCDLPDPHFYIYMTKAKVIPEKKIVTGPAYLVIEDVPIPLVLPFGFFPNKKGRTSGVLIPKPGDDSERGFYLREGGFYFGYSDYFDLKLIGDVYTLGSWKANAVSNYVKRYQFNGLVDVSYASNMIDEERQPYTFNVAWTHRQDSKARPNSTFNANVNYGSVGHKRQNARDEDEFLNNTMRSSITFDRSFPNTPFRTNMALTHSQNSLDSIVNLTIPQLSLSMSSVTPLKRKHAAGSERWYENLRMSYNSEMQNKLTTKMDSTFYTQATLDKFRSGVRHSVPLSTTWKFLKYFSLNPSFTYTERWTFEKIARSWDPDTVMDTKYPHKRGGVLRDTIPGFYRVWDYSLGAGLTTNIYGMYAFRSKYIKAIRHKMTPSVSYTYKPNFGYKNYGYYDKVQTDTLGTVQSYNYYESSVYSDLPGNTEVSSIGFSLGNNLEMKVRNLKDTITGTRKIVLIENLSASISYNMAADSMNWDYLNVNGNTNIFKRVNVRYSAQMDPYALDKNKKTGDIYRSRNLMWDNYGRVWRLDNSKWEISTNLTLGPIKDKEKAKANQNKPKDAIDYFSHFEVPWNVTMSYTISLPRRYFYNEYNCLDSVSSTVIQTLGVGATVSITKNWKVRVSSGWDFEAQKITYTRFDFFRDLHCWDMSFMWIPFGAMQRYEFLVKVKASMFQDLKMEKKKSYGEIDY